MLNERLFKMLDEKLDVLKQEEQYLVYIEGYTLMDADSEEELNDILTLKLKGLTLTPLIVGKRKDYNL
jgi:hypothetical protein